MLKFLFSRIPQETSKPQILLIDGSRDIRTVTSLWLETRGFGTTLEAASAGQGLRLAQQHRPAAILLDLQLPDMRGEIVLQLLKPIPGPPRFPSSSSQRLQKDSTLSEPSPSRVLS